MASSLKMVIAKAEKALGATLSDFRSGLEPADRAERVLGFVVSSDFEGQDHPERNAKLRSVLSVALTRDELRLVGPIVTMTPAEAEIDWTWDRLRRLWEVLVEQVGRFHDREPAWWTGAQPELRECLESFVESEGFPRAKWAAAHMQVKFGVTQQRELKNPSNARTWIRNHAAALEAGFLRTKDLPEQMAIGR